MTVTESWMPDFHAGVLFTEINSALEKEMPGKARNASFFLYREIFWLGEIIERELEQEPEEVS